MCLFSGNLASTIIEKVSDGVSKRMDESEARRDREFSYKLKELEFYKGNYDEEIKSVFDSWFNLLQYSMLSTNKHLTEEEKQAYNDKVIEYSRPEKTLERNVNTIKYGGTETGKALALYNQIIYSYSNEAPKYAVIYAICVLLSTLKQEILGQEIAPDTILMVLLNDYAKQAKGINDSRVFVENLKARLFPEEQV